MVSRITEHRTARNDLARARKHLRKAPLAHCLLMAPMSEPGEANMSVRQHSLLSAMLAATTLTPVLAQGVAPGAGRPDSAQVTASVPDFSGAWAHSSLNGLEQPLSGPGPLRNRSRLLTGPQVGVGDGRQLVGDYTNPILQPWAADVVKKFGEISLAGKGYPTPRNQCWPEQVPFVFANYGMQIVQQAETITILYPFDHQFRQVRMNAQHPAQVVPSWSGDSVGHYEGATLVIDTVGIKFGPFSMMDWYGTPFTDSIHVVERYRFIDYEATNEAVERAAKDHFQFDNPDNGPRADPNYKGKGLQIELTVDDKGAFTMPWTATVTFRRALDEWLELVCSENPAWHPGTYAKVPRADKPDF